MTAKLVRDRDPEIIRDRGNTPITYTADPDEYRRHLAAKLREETTAATIAMERDDQAAITEALADLLEAAYAIAVAYGIPIGDVDSKRIAKLRARGGFGARIVWAGNAPQEAP